MELTDEMIARGCSIYLQEHPDFREQLDQMIEAAGLDRPEINLTPSYHGESCQGNGEYPGIECQCDECDSYLVCFPDWREVIG